MRNHNRNRSSCPHVSITSGVTLLLCIRVFLLLGSTTNLAVLNIVPCSVEASRIFSPWHRHYRIPPPLPKIARGGDSGGQGFTGEVKEGIRETQRTAAETAAATTKSGTGECYQYTKVAIVNLSQVGIAAPRQDYKIQPVQDHESPLVSFLMEKWIRPILECQVGLGGRANTEEKLPSMDHASEAYKGKIIAIPSHLMTGETEFLEGTFTMSSLDTRQQDGGTILGDIVETVGCLADCIILCYDVSYSSRQSCIVRLIKGVERQRNSYVSSDGERDNAHDKKEEGNEGKSATVQILFLAMDQDAQEELIAIKDVIGEGDADLGDRIHIIPCGTSKGNEELLRNVLDRVTGQTANVHAAVPLDLFPKLAKRVFSRVGKDIVKGETLAFETRRLALKDRLKKVEMVKKESADQTPEGLLSHDLEYIVGQHLEKLLVEIDEKLSHLESKQDEVLFDENKMPILEFGRDATNILTIATKAFDTRKVKNLIRGKVDGDYIQKKRIEVIDKVNDKVRRLFENQLNSLREYYGRKYEAVIEKLEDSMGSDIFEMDQEELMQLRRKHDALLAEEAKRSTEGFRAAAENAIPGIVKNGALKTLSMGYTYDRALDGLIRDMMKATSDSQNLEDEWQTLNGDDDVDVDDGGDGTNVLRQKRRGPVKWYEKVAARLLVFGVNYLQGWLAYQGVKKAALERDRMMPKFPLF